MTDQDTGSRLCNVTVKSLKEPVLHIVLQSVWSDADSLLSETLLQKYDKHRFIRRGKNQMNTYLFIRVFIERLHSPLLCLVPPSDLADEA